jgi:hypothetical protein
LDYGRDGSASKRVAIRRRVSLTQDCASSSVLKPLI